MNMSKNNLDLELDLNLAQRTDHGHMQDHDYLLNVNPDTLLVHDIHPSYLFTPI